MTFNQVVFDKDYLPSVLSAEVQDISDCWLGISHWENSWMADASELEAINKFIECLGKGAIQDSEKLIKLSLNPLNLTVSDFYSPALFRKEHPESGEPAELIILFGCNQIPVRLENGDFLVGDLKGNLSEREINDKQYPCIQFLSSDDSWEFTLPIRAIDKNCSKAELRPLIRKPEEFLSKIMGIPKDRGNFINLPDLGECEILIKGLEAHDSQYGLRFYLELNHKLFTRSNKSLTGFLEKSHKKIANLLEQGKPITLKIWDISSTSAGNPYCKAMLYPRVPNPEIEWAFLQSQKSLKSAGEEAPIALVNGKAEILF